MTLPCGNCTDWPNDCGFIKANPDIAGIGVITAFTLSVFISFVSASYAIFYTDLVVFPDWTPIDDYVHKRLSPAIWTWLRGRPRRVQRRSQATEDVVRRFILGLSDQHMIFGATIMMTGFIQHCSISVYHWNIVLTLACFSANIHSLTFIVLREYLWHAPKLVWIRAFVMSSIFVMTVVAFVLSSHRDLYNGWNCQAQCAFDTLAGNIGGEPASWAFAQLCLLVYGYGDVICWVSDRAEELRVRWFIQKPLAHIGKILNSLQDKWAKARRANADPNTASGYQSTPLGSILSALGMRVRGLVLTLLLLFMKCFYALVFTWLALMESLYVGLCLQLAWFVWNLYTIITDRVYTRSLLDDEDAENVWGFGQVLPVLLILLPIYTLGATYIEKRELQKRHSSKLLSNSDVSSLPTSSRPASTAEPGTASTSSHGMAETVLPANTNLTGQIEYERPRRADTEMRVGLPHENDGPQDSTSTSVNRGISPLRRQPTINADDESSRNMTHIKEIGI